MKKSIFFRTITILLVACMAVSMLAGCAKKEAPIKETEQGESKPESEEIQYDLSKEIELGYSSIAIYAPASYEPGEITREDTDESQVAYWHSEEYGLDFDIYEWVLASDETLKDAAIEEAKEYKASAQRLSIGDGYEFYMYSAKETYEEKEYVTHTYMTECDGEIIEIVFWLDGEEAEGLSKQIIESVHECVGEETREKIPAGCIALGHSGYYICPDIKFIKGEISKEDTDESQVAYYYSEESEIDFDVYEWHAAAGETLRDAVMQEAEEYDVQFQDIDIGEAIGFYYDAIEEYEGKEYKTRTYMFSEDGGFVEIVFWLDGENAEAEVEKIMETIKLIGYADMPKIETISGVMKLEPTPYQISIDEDFQTVSIGDDSVEEIGTAKSYVSKGDAYLAITAECGEDLSLEEKIDILEDQTGLNAEEFSAGEISGYKIYIPANEESDYSVYACAYFFEHDGKVSEIMFIFEEAELLETVYRYMDTIQYAE